MEPLTTVQNKYYRYRFVPPVRRCQSRQLYGTGTFPGIKYNLPNVFLNQCCGSGMFTPRIPDPDFLSILDPGYNNSTRRGQGKKNFVLPFFVATNNIKL
jgi:hypothetical protein